MISQNLGFFSRYPPFFDPLSSGTWSLPKNSLPKPSFSCDLPPPPVYMRLVMSVTFTQLHVYILSAGGTNTGVIILTVSAHSWIYLPKFSTTPPPPRLLAKEIVRYVRVLCGTPDTSFLRIWPLGFGRSLVGLFKGECQSELVPIFMVFFWWPQLTAQDTMWSQHGILLALRKALQICVDEFDEEVFQHSLGQDHGFFTWLHKPNR